jgi:hypothetical protein
MVPFGLESATRTIGTLKIWNDGSGTLTNGNYQYSLSMQTKIQGAATFTGNILKFPRKTQDAFDLLQLVISDIQNQRKLFPKSESTKSNPTSNKSTPTTKRKPRG